MRVLRLTSLKKPVVSKDLHFGYSREVSLVYYDEDEDEGDDGPAADDGAAAGREVACGFA